MENFNQVQKRKIEDSSEDDKESKKMHKDSLFSKSQIAAELTLIDEAEDSAQANEIMESLDLSDSSLVDDKTFDDHINTIVSIVNSVPDEEVSSPQDCIDKHVNSSVNQIDVKKVRKNVNSDIQEEYL